MNRCWSAFVFKLMHFLWLYSARVPCTFAQRMGAALAGTALTHTIAIAILRGILLKGNGWQALATVVFYLVLTFIVDYLFKPKFVGNQANLPPLLVLLSIIGGMSLSGVMGIIYGPLAVTAFFTLVDMYFLEYQPYFDNRDQQGRQDES